MSESIDLALLETFVEVAQRGSVALAARALHRSQPAISHRLRALDEELGVALFERVGRRLRLSAQGAALLGRAQELLALARELRTASKAEPRSGTVTIATLPALAAHVLAVEAARQITSRPDVQLVFRFALAQPLVELVRRGEADLGLYAGALEARGLEASVVGQIHLAVALAPGRWPRSPLSPQQLRQMRYLAWTGLDDPTMDIVARYAQRHELAVEHTPRVPHIETLREIVASGAGYALLPSYTLRNDERRGRIAVRRARGLDETVPLVCVRRRAASSALVDSVRARLEHAAQRASRP